MTLEADMLRKLDGIGPRLHVSEQRLAPLAEEVSLFGAAIEAVRERVDFTSEPAGYRAAVDALTAEHRRD